MWVNFHAAVRSILTGNVRDFSYQTNVGDLDFKYAREYGLVWRMGGALGVRLSPHPSTENY